MWKGPGCGQLFTIKIVAAQVDFCTLSHEKNETVATLIHSFGLRHIKDQVDQVFPLARPDFWVSDIPDVAF
jgi:hypothetical protein